MARARKQSSPLKLLVAGDFSHGKETAPLSERKKVNLNKNNFDAVLSEYSSEVNLTVQNTLAGDGTQLVWITPDSNPLKFIMRSELGDGPLALLKLKDFSLPQTIFSVGTTDRSLILAGDE